MLFRSHSLLAGLVSEINIVLLFSIITFYNFFSCNYGNGIGYVVCSRLLDTEGPTNNHKLNKHIQGSLIFRITIESLCKTRYCNRKLSPKSENKIPAQVSPYYNPPSILIHSLHLFVSSIASPLWVH